LRQLAKRNELDKDPAFLPWLKRPASDIRMVEELAKKISVQVRRGTRLIDIGVEDRSPVLAQSIADLLIKEFAYENFRRHIDGSEMASNFLLEKAQRLKAKLAKSEEALRTYKEETSSRRFRREREHRCFIKGFIEEYPFDRRRLRA
jgi:polysaccharide biosynthesis transport protein